MLLLVNPIDVELYVWIGDLGYCQSISMIVLHSGIFFLAMMYSAAISASAAEAITYLMIFAIVNTGPLDFGFGLFSDRNIWRLVSYGLWIY